jgi:hypothetical protein
MFFSAEHAYCLPIAKRNKIFRFTSTIARFDVSYTTIASVLAQLSTKLSCFLTHKETKVDHGRLFWISPKLVVSLLTSLKVVLAQSLDSCGSAFIWLPDSLIQPWGILSITLI